MIVRIQKGGKSFKWLLEYLSHDANKAKTSERVEWTDTINLAHQHLSSAVDEMYWTYRAADQLKRAAGISTGGTPLKHPVKHLSLNWHPSEQPTKQEMIEAARDFIRYMGWQDHQAVLVAHNDRPHKHVHLMINCVSPIDGRSLSAGYEWNRAERWRENYDRERRRDYCEQDRKAYEEREKAPTREAWLKFKDAEKAFEKDEAERAARAPDYFDRHAPGEWKAKEWEALRGYQKEQRTDFFDGGKKAYRDVRNAAFREVRSQFSEEWRTWFQLRREGFDPTLLGEIKKGILERQNAELDKRRDEACKELRERRDEVYKDLLQRQKEERAELNTRQNDGLHTYDLLDRSQGADLSNRTKDPAVERESIASEFGATARETTQPRQDEREEGYEHEPHAGDDSEPGKQRHKVRDPVDAAGLLGLGALGAIAELGERLFDGFLGGGETLKPKPRPRERAEPDSNDRKPRDAERRQRAQEELADEAARLYAFWEERRRSRSRDRD